MYTPKIYAFADEASKQLDAQIRAMLRNGLQGLEIRGVDGENVSKITLEKARDIRAKLDDNGLIIWSVGSPIGKIKLTDDIDAHLDTLRHTLEVANILGAKNLRMFSFYMPKDEDPTPYKGQVMDWLGRMIETAEGSGVDLCHENEKGIYGDIATRCLEIHQTFPTLKGVFDPANFVQCGDDTIAGWELLKDYIYYLHIKDAVGIKVVPAGMGDGNVAYIVRKYLEKGGSAMTVEPHLKAFVGLSALEESGAESAVGQFAYPDSDAAFDAACNALKTILKAEGFA